MFYQAKQNHEFGRLRVWDQRSKPRTASALSKAFTLLNAMKTKLAIPENVVEHAAYIYRKAVSKKLTRGRTMASLIAASLYASCRDNNIPRTLKEIAETANIKKGDLAVCYRLLVKELDLKMPVVDSVQNVARIASKIGLSEKTKRYAIEILRKAEENKISAGKNPMGLAASALYLSCVKTGEEHSQREIAEAANITSVTVRNRYKGLLELLKN